MPPFTHESMSESTIKLMIWGNVTTDMIMTYVHLCNADIDRSVAEMAGIGIPGSDAQSSAMEPRQYQRCWTENPPTLRFCGECGLELTAEATQDKRTAEEQIEADPRFQAWMKAATRLTPKYLQ